MDPDLVTLYSPILTTSFPLNLQECEQVVFCIIKVCVCSQERDWFPLNPKEGHDKNAEE